MVITKKAVKDEYYRDRIAGLFESLDINFINIEHYVLAFIHRSIVNERPDKAPEHNERLEFLGDAVLELITTHELYKEFPEKTEGELTDIRSALVRGKNLAEVAKKLGLSEYLLLGKGEEKTGGRDNDYILANTVEAIIGAIYIDLGIEESKKFVLKYIYSTLVDILKKNLTKDYKTLFQEHAQAVFEITPEYKLISESGPDHDKSFEIGVYVGDKLYGTGKGTSKKKAQENAAKIAYLDLIKK